MFGAAMRKAKPQQRWAIPRQLCIFPSGMEHPTPNHLQEHNLDNLEAAHISITIFY